MLGLGTSIVTQGFVGEEAITPLLLDTYTGAAAAYSLRRLSNSYTGSAIEVSDGTNTQDIGFDANGDLDTAALATFCGSNNGFVTKWYDQSGNSKDATQTTASKQPKIYDGTNGVEKQNGKPCIKRVDGNSQLSFSLAGNANQHHFTVATPSVNQFVLTNDTSDASNYYLAGQDGVTTSPNGLVTGGDFYLNGTLSNSTVQTRNNLYDDLINTQSLLSQKINNSVYGSAQYFGYGASVSFSMMDMQEAIFYNSDQYTNRTGIEEDIAEYYTQNTPLLDTHTGAEAAYSLRKLRTAYTGDAIRVRRSNDDAETDIGFNVFGGLDTAALRAHCGSNNGFVTKWYDQSGNSNDAVQATTASQPKIYDGSSVIKENGKPAIQMDSNTKNLSVSDSKATFKFLHDGSSSSTTWVVSPTDARETSGTTEHELFETGEFSTSVGLEIFYTSSQYSGTETARFLVKNGTASAVDYTTPAQTFDVGQNLVNFYIDANNATAADRFKVGVNGATLLTGNTLTAAPSTANSQLDFTLYGGFTAHWQEVIVWDSDQSSNRTDIETNINDYYSIY